MKLSEIRHILDTRQIALTKSLGQNFLHDGNQLRRLVAAAELEPTDRVLEVGPGLGVLTELLTPQAREVLALEIDGRLYEFLCERFAGTDNLSLRHADAVEFFAQSRDDWSQWKLVSNLPFSVASRIIVELSVNEHGPKRLVITLQWEAAKRLTAQAGDTDYGLLAILVQLHYQAVDSFKIPPTCFFPEPGVDSAGITLVRRNPPLLESTLHTTFNRLVKRSFSQRRKTMIKLLKQDWPVEVLEPAFHQLDLGLQVRAEAVSLDQFVALTRLLDGSR
jgi:16S rRNA (adenine1518-N6/adenine1519-N6)-dimethyltransferase